jgi:hypothetical protein
VFAVAPIPSAAPLFQGARKATVWFLLCPALTLALLLLVFVAPGSRRGLLLALPAVLALPTMSLVPGVFEEYLPLSRPVDRMESTSRTALIMWGSLIAMTVIAGAAYLAWTWGLFWYLVGIEALVLVVLHVVWTGWIRRRPIGQ